MGIFSFEGSLCGSGIEPRLIDDDTMPTPKFRGVENSSQQINRLILAMCLPAQPKEIRLLLQSFGVGEKEKSPALFQFLTGRHHALHSL